MYRFSEEQIHNMLIFQSIPGSQQGKQIELSEIEAGSMVNIKQVIDLLSPDRNTMTIIGVSTDDQKGY